MLPTITPSFSVDQHAQHHASLGMSICSASGKTVTVSPFSVGGLNFSGGSIIMPAAGTWYVGVELFSNVLRCLPRLGHRGWVPVARAVCTSSTITDLKQITPVVPACRIPRTMAKVLAGQSISVVIMGSSLTQSGGASTDWPGMVFGSGTVDKYKVPTTITTKYTGVGASPNQYQLAQLGLSSYHTASGYAQSGAPSAAGGLSTLVSPPYGRSTLFDGVDLVVIGCLANGGDYRLETIEPLARKLRQAGVEVIMVTDNPQGPSTDYSTMSGASLYVDGPEVMRVADLYGVELADTAAYVFEAYLRAGGVGIYADAIHQASGTPSGPSSLLPANGHEAWARAVRSVFSVGVNPLGSGVQRVSNGSFSTAGTAGWASYAGGTISNIGGALNVVASAAGLGTIYEMGAFTAGSIVTLSLNVTAVASGQFQIGVTKGYSWDGASQTLNISTPGTQTVQFTASGGSSYQILAWSQGAAANFTITNVSVIEVTPPTAFNAIPNRPAEAKPMPPIRVVTDVKTPADAFVILPKLEFCTLNNSPNKGTLGAHPWGSASFARRWSSLVGASEDLLTLTTGQRAQLSGVCPVGFALIHYRDVSDGACTFTVSLNGSVQKTINISVPPFANEWFVPIYTPTEFATPSAAPDGRDNYELMVTSGTLKIAALVALTFDYDLVPYQQLTYNGSWLPAEASRSNLLGRPTDTLNDWAGVFCTGRRVAWILSGNPGTKLTDFYSDRDRTLALDVSGNYHIYTRGSLFGPGSMHYVRCAQANASGSQANGHALHVGGAIIINDR